MMNKKLISFADAMAASRKGHRVTREAWHDQAWVTAADGQLDLDASKFWNKHSRAQAERNGGKANVRPYMLACLDGEIIMGWAPGPEEVQTDDWFILPEGVESATSANGIADGKADGVSRLWDVRFGDPERVAPHAGLVESLLRARLDVIENDVPIFERKASTASRKVDELLAEKADIREAIEKLSR